MLFMRGEVSHHIFEELSTSLCSMRTFPRCQGLRIHPRPLRANGVEDCAISEYREKCLVHLPVLGEHCDNTEEDSKAGDDTK